MAPPHGKAHSGPDASRKSALCNLRLTESRTLRSPDRTDRTFPSHVIYRLRFSVTSRRPGGVGQPPARLRGTMGNGPTGQTRSSNPPPACGAACARVRRSRFGVWPHGKAHSAQPVGSECAFPSRRDRRMRLSVRVPAQNALFRRVRLSSPGQTWRRLMEKRILLPASHGKAHSATYVSRKAALCHPQIARTAPFRDVAAPGRCGTTPPPGCGALWETAQLGKRARATPRQPAGRLAPGSADLGSESGLTERRTLPNRWAQNALFRHDATAECVFP